MKLYAPSIIRELQEKNKIKPVKTLGQNFLADKNTLDKIIENSDIGPRDLVIEIGPGLGVLTEEICQRAGMVIAVEIDKKLIPILKDNLKTYNNLRIINEDVLKTDLRQLIKDTEGTMALPVEKVKLVANLPYYITSPIIMKLLEEKLPLDTITVMVQKEVGERLVAKPSSKEYGAITLAVEYYAKAQIIMKVSKEVFIPKPKVDSVVVRLDIREEPYETKDEKLLLALIKRSFMMRRKTLLNNLTGFLGFDKMEMGEILQKAGIDGERRGEALSLKEFNQIVDEIVKYND